MMERNHEGAEIRFVPQPRHSNQRTALNRESHRQLFFDYSIGRVLVAIENAKWDRRHVFLGVGASVDDAHSKQWMSPLYFYECCGESRFCQWTTYSRDGAGVERRAI